MSELSSGKKRTQMEDVASQQMADGTHANLLHGHVAHATRGRMRIRLDTHGGDRSKFSEVEKGLRNLPGVSGVEVHAKTGSVVIHHASSNPEFLEYVRKWIADTGLMVLKGSDDPAIAAKELTAVERDTDYLLDHSKSGQMLVRYSEHFNRAVKHSTQGWIDLRILVPASVGLCALIFAGVETAPLWVPLTLFSLQSFSNLHQPRTVLADKQPAAVLETMPASSIEAVDSGSLAASVKRKRANS
jgi:hypothetical protein